MDIRYSHVISRFYPNAECYSTGPLYSDIVWLSAPVSKADLDVKMLETAKNIRADAVREESVHVRTVATKLVVGTSDIYMLRTYDVKKAEADRFIQDNPADNEIDITRYNLLAQEADSTGVPLRLLAAAVVQQYQASEQYLNPILGAVEAARRNKIAEIEAAVSMDALNDIGETVWPDLTMLNPI